MSASSPPDAAEGSDGAYRDTAETSAEGNLVSATTMSSSSASQQLPESELPPLPPVRTVTTGQKVGLLLVSPFLLVVLAVYAVVASPFILSGRLSAQPESAKIEPALSADEASTRKGRYTRNSRGLWLYQRAWLPSSPPVGVVFMVHGLAEHISRNGYEELGRRLTAAGYAVHGMDAVGHGRSSGLRCYLQSWSELWEDELFFIKSFDAVYSKDTPRFLFGHRSEAVRGSSSSRRQAAALPASSLCLVRCCGLSAALAAWSPCMWPSATRSSALPLTGSSPAMSSPPPQPPRILRSPRR